VDVADDKWEEREFLMRKKNISITHLSVCI